MESFQLLSRRRLGPVANVEADGDRDADLQLRVSTLLQDGRARAWRNPHRR